ncbi:MAG: DUF4468 domain-containing protein [Hymenobacter sp.]|nr:MAG: DUF4468 domain-containing protein [Hymenobacter sp.]
MDSYLLLALALFSAAPIAHAQKAKDYKQFDEIEFKVVPGQDQLPAYSALADTTHKAFYRIARDKTVNVIGEYSPRWAVINNHGAICFVRQKDLAGLAPGQTVKQVAAISNAVLPLDENTHRITYTGVVPVAGTKQAELLARAKVWANGVVVNTTRPVVTNEQGTDVVTVSGSHPMNIKMPLSFGVSNALLLRFTATISIREGRYQYRLTEFILDVGQAVMQPAAKPQVISPGCARHNLASDRLASARLSGGKSAWSGCDSRV